MSNIIHNKHYRNWVRGALGLLYVQEGLYPFTDRVVKDEHARIIQRLKPCTSCTVRNIQPAHTKGTACIHKSKGKCNCRQKSNKKCDTCGQLYDEIIIQHRFRDPFWETDASTWYTDHWQIAKCFMTTTPGLNNTAAETDAAGLLSIIINGIFFQSELQCNIDPPHDKCSQVREIRNKILHNSTLELTDTEVTSYLKDMIAVLEDKKTLISDPSAQAAVKKLKEIVKDELVITTKEEARAIQTALDAIKKAKEQAEKDITDLAEEKKQELETAKETAVGEVRSTVAEYEPEVKLKLDDHEKRLKALEDNMSEINEKLKNIKDQVDLLSKTEDKHQTRMDYLKQKQDLQHHLVELYQTHDVKTWLSPLITEENDFNISSVYVSPNMVVEEKDDRDRSKPEKCASDEAGMMHSKTNKEPEKSAHVKQLRHITCYQDIFCSCDGKNKRIYIIGDVGTGKTSFCKMMMENWCRAVTEKWDKRELDMGNENLGPVDDGNIRDMSAFELLFYVPLQFMSGKTDDIAEMIKKQLPQYSALIDKIFSDESERCLLLADGLDEWTPPQKSESRLLPHETYGLLASRLECSATIITTSRPSARGILDMKSSECDLKVILLGVKELKSIIQKYMALLGKSSPDAVNNFYQKLQHLNLKDLQEAPMLLQQLTCMYCDDNEKNDPIDQSITYIYTHFVNTVLGWEKGRECIELPDFRKTLKEPLQLPKFFEYYTRCQANCDLILLLGKVAYDIFIEKDVSSVVLHQNKLKQLGLNKEEISAVVQVGILHEVKCANPIYAKSQLSFIHTSYLEYFAAVYISSYCLSQTQTSQSTLIEDLILRNTSAAELLRLKNVLIMVCGLSPLLTDFILECICRVAYRDEQLVKYRRETRYYYFRYYMSGYPNLAQQIQDTSFRCVSEAYSTDPQLQLRINLCDCIVQTQEQLEICLSCVKSVRFATICPELCFLHQQFTSLSSFLSQAASLESLELTGITCEQSECDGHSIDLSHHEQLQMLELCNCDKIFVCGDTSTTNLKSCEIRYCKLSHQQCTSLSSFVSQAASLESLQLQSITCEQDECDGHSIDLSHLKQLQMLELCNCDKIFVCGDTSTTNLKSCEINDCWLSHQQCTSLSSFVSQAASLESLNLTEITCEQDECDGHSIDLSHHEQLQMLELCNCDKISVCGDTSTTNLKSCVISSCWLSHQQCTSLSSFVSQAASLESLNLTEITCEQDECDGHSIDLSHHEQLQMLELCYCDKISVCGDTSTTNLKSCVISSCWLSHQQFTSLSSFLSQAASLESLELTGITCEQSECDGHSIDLSHHEQLQMLELCNCDKIFVCGDTSTTNLKSCEIRYCKLSHQQCTSLSSFVSQAASLESLQLQSITCEQDECDGHSIDLSHLKQLQMLELCNCDKIFVCGDTSTTNLKSCEITYCKLSHQQCTSLSSFVSQAASLESLNLTRITCEQDECDGHSIDLSHHEQLQKLQLFNCNQISVCGDTSTTNLKSCVISSCWLSHQQCTSLSSFVSQAASLESLNLTRITCEQDECDGHSIDLSHHEQLQKLKLYTCNQIFVCGDTPTTNLKSCEINDCWLSHQQFTSLSSFLSQAASLESLDLTGITCEQDECDGHSIDLSHHEQLQKLKLFNCNQISVCGDTPTTNLKSCEISDCKLSHQQCTSLSSFLSQAASLKSLYLESVTCKQSECDGHSIDISHHEQIRHLGQIDLFQKTCSF